MDRAPLIDPEPSTSQVVRAVAAQVLTLIPGRPPGRELGLIVSLLDEPEPVVRAAIAHLMAAGTVICRGGVTKPYRFHSTNNERSHHHDGHRRTAELTGQESLWR